MSSMQDAVQDELNEHFDIVVKEQTGSSPIVLTTGQLPPAVDGNIPEEQELQLISRNIDTYVADIRNEITRQVQSDTRFVKGVVVTRRSSMRFAPIAGANEGKSYKGCFASIAYSIA